MCAGALALAVLPPLGKLVLGLVPSGQLWTVWQTWIVRALTFLVISCPCALVISVPLSFFGGIGCASKNGILVKGTNYLEALASAGIVVFDKTGTLTRGVFQVTGLYPAEGFTREKLLEQAALAESASGHPISQSLKEAYGKEPEPNRVEHMEEVAGYGVKAVVDGAPVLAGNLRLMQAEGIPVAQRYDQGTTVYVAVNGQYAGCITISDVVKPTAKEALAALKKSGVRRTVMLTGDAQAAARQAADRLGMDEVRSELLPADKVAEVERLLEQKKPGEKLVFVGDGINDAPVLSRADIGVAMGALGSDAAIEAADVVLMDDDPAKLALAMSIARRTLKIVRQNIFFALAIKLVCLILGAAGIANMWVAIFADVGVMVLAVLNATRALKNK